MKSKLLMEEVVENKERRFGSNLQYFPVKVVGLDGKEYNALFTESQIDEAKKRALSNPEDLPKEKFLFGIFG